MGHRQERAKRQESGPVNLQVALKLVSQKINIVQEFSSDYKIVEILHELLCCAQAVVNSTSCIKRKSFAHKIIPQSYLRFYHCLKLN